MRAAAAVGHAGRVVGRTLAGPWPIYPGAMALVAIYGLFISAGSRTQVVHKTIGSYFGAVLPQWAAIAITCTFIYLVLHALVAVTRRVRPVEASRAAYLLALLVASLLVTGFTVTMTTLTVDDKLRAALPPIEVRFVLSLPVIVIVLYVGNGVIAAARMRIARQEDLLGVRLDLVRSERALLLAAEEQVRAEASRTLHDDVQAALLRAVVRLEGIRDGLDGEAQQRFDASIDEIETVREVSVRSLGRVLAPSIADVGLLHALEELGELYTDVMTVAFAAPPDVVERFRPIGGQDDLALALYRIAEQLLLNALKHGRATCVDVALEHVAGGCVRMTVRDDGSSPPEQSAAGAGTATINAWLDTVGGSWELRAVDGGAEAVVVAGRAG